MICVITAFVCAEHDQFIYATIAYSPRKKELTKIVVVVAHIYPSVTGQRQTLTCRTIRRVARNSQWAFWGSGGLGAKPPAAGGWEFGGKPPAAGGMGVWGRSTQRSKILHFLAKITSF